MSIVTEFSIGDRLYVVKARDDELNDPWVWDVPLSYYERDGDFLFPITDPVEIERVAHAHGTYILDVESYTWEPNRPREPGGKMVFGLCMDTFESVELVLDGKKVVMSIMDTTRDQGVEYALLAQLKSAQLNQEARRPYICTFTFDDQGKKQLHPLPEGVDVEHIFSLFTERWANAPLEEGDES